MCKKKDAGSLSYSEIKQDFFFFIKHLLKVIGEINGGNYHARVKSVCLFCSRAIQSFPPEG